MRKTEEGVRGGPRLSTAAGLGPNPQPSINLTVLPTSAAARTLHFGILAAICGLAASARLTWLWAQRGPPGVGGKKLTSLLHPTHPWFLILDPGLELHPMGCGSLC